MPVRYTPVRCLLTLGLLLPAGAAWAQAPVISVVIPQANARAAARTGPVGVTFSQALTPASAGALKVFSAQRGGLRTRGATPATVSGNTLSFAPTAYPFMPGETVQATVTTAAASSSGSLARPRVLQFSTAVTPSTGIFAGGSDPVMDLRPNRVTMGDLDGDGDLDMSTIGSEMGAAGIVTIRLNNGAGIFSGGQSITTSRTPQDLVQGDVDADGDLDVIIATIGANRANFVEVYLNNGSAGFTNFQNLSLGATQASGLAIGDLDGDGDLDLVAATNSLSGMSPLNILINNGSGQFTGGQTISVSNGVYYVKLGDLDGDGDLDIVVNSPSFVTCTYLNNGSGTFSLGQTITMSIIGSVNDIALADVDGDGDLDLLACRGLVWRAYIFTNDGAGIFALSQTLNVGSNPLTLATGDVDGDGNMDLCTLNHNDRTVSIRLNNGSGTFSGTQEVAIQGQTQQGSVVIQPGSVALADVDDDGDLDLLASGSGALPNSVPGVVSVRLNGSMAMAAYEARGSLGLELYPNPVQLGTAVHLTGLAAQAPVQVLDALGRPVLVTKATASGTAELALPSSARAGLYLVRSGTQVLRLAVE